MPNITNNKVRFISKNKSSLEKVKNSLMQTEIHTKEDGTKETYLQVFDFDKIVPMPKHIFRGGLITDLKNGIDYKKEYGKNNWYDWSCLHWGTKWNAMYAKITEDNENALSYHFESAWDCPRGIAYVIEDFLPKDVKVDYWICEHEFEFKTETILPIEKSSQI